MNSNWISVEDRLPEDGTSVIAYAPDGKDQIKEIIKQVYYNQNRWSSGYYNNSLNGVTHWQTLPSSPNEGGGEF